MHYSFAILFAQLGAYAVALFIAVVCFVVVVTRSAIPTTREASTRTLRAGLLGGLVFTSSPFWWVLYPLLGAQNFIVNGNRYLQTNVFGSSQWYPYWLPDFFFGFTVAVVIVYFGRKWSSQRAQTA
jgi:hypothetical protein